MAKLFSSPLEAQALRGLCSSRQQVSGLLFSQLDETFFHSKEAKESYKAIRSHVEKHGNPPPFKTLYEDLRLSEEARDFLMLASAAPKDSPQAQSVSDALNAYRKSRLTYLMAKGIIEKMQQPKVDIDLVVEEASNQIAKVHVRRSLEDTIFHIGRDSNVQELIEELIFGEANDNCIPTGFKSFDSHSGGYFRGSLVTLGGATSSGKSLLAQQIAANQAALGYKVLFVPLEMTLVEMLGRAVSNTGKMENTRVQLKRLAPDEKELAYKRFRRWEKSVRESNGRLTIFKPKEDLSIEEIMAAIHSFGSDIVYIDYISLLKGADGDDQWRKLGAIARFGKIYAEAHNKVVVLLAQVNQEGRLRYAQAIGEHSNTAWSFVATKDSREKGYLKIEPFKGRNQVLRPFILKVDYSTQRAYDPTPEELDELTDRKSNAEKADKPSQPTLSEDDKSYMPDLSE